MRSLVKKVFFEAQRRAVLVRARIHGPWESATDKFVIFVLHSVAPSTSDMAVSAERLREHLGALRAAGYRCLRLQELLDAVEHARSISQPCYALTFDDGYESVYSEALPILREFQVSATLFLTVDFLNRKVAPPWGSANPGLVAEYVRDGKHFRPLSWSQARELAGCPEFDIGSHSVNHHLLARLSGEALVREFQNSKSELENRLGIGIGTFSYPFGIGRYGAYSETTEQVLRQSGYIASFTSEIGRAKVGSGPFLLPRISLTNGDSAADAVAKAAGGYDWVRFAQSTFHKIFPNPH